MIDVLMNSNSSRTIIPSQQLGHKLENSKWRRNGSLIDNRLCHYTYCYEKPNQNIQGGDYTNL